MMHLAEYRRKATRLADYLPWAALVAPGVVLNKDGSLQRTARFRGPDLDSAVAAELVAVAGRINSAFRRLGSGWAIFVEAHRLPAADYPDSRFPDPASALLDAERRAGFAEQGAHFQSAYFPTFLYLPPPEEAARAETWLYEGRETRGIDAGEVLRGFIDRTDRVLALFDGFMPECRWLDDAETLTYLHSTISTHAQRVRVPETPVYLDALLADQPLTTGLEPRLGAAHLRILTLSGFPTATTPGILDELNRLAFPYRWATRAILMDKVQATRMVARIRRYPGAQVFAFDFGGSIRAAILAMGGDWHDLGGALTEGTEAGVYLQPLARIDEGTERAWAAGWIAAILAREGVTVTPEVKEHLWSALTSLASAPIGERTITGLAVLLQSSDLKQALRPYCLGGPHGRLLDAEIEDLGTAPVQAFEIEGLIGTAAAPAVLSYLFHRIGDRLGGRPTLLIIDEGWLALDDEGFAGQLREWLKTLRKKNAAVIFATQSLSDIDASAIAPAIIESCPTRLLLPNERAIEPQITAIYRRFGLNDRQIEIVARAMPKRDYYCQSRRGNRLFELGLSEVGLALCAASSKADQAQIAAILSEHGRDGFLAAWLHARGAGWAADLIPELPNLETDLQTDPATPDPASDPKPQPEEEPQP